MKKLLTLLILILLFFSYAFVTNRHSDEPVPIPPSPQREGGNARLGYDYLINGDYVKGGIPENIFRMGIGKPKIYLKRDDINEGIPHDYTAVKAANGEILIAPNCLQCHAQVFDDKLYIGLGNSFADFSDRETLNNKNLEKAEKFLKTFAPKKYKAAATFFEVAKTIGPYLYTEAKGVNAADRLAAVLAAHRDPVTFKWIQEASMPIPEAVIPTDVPAWWLLKKKNGMFYNGFGRGDFGKFLMASNLLTVTDTSESAAVDKHMPDVLAYINSLQPPKYPGKIDFNKAEKGRILFNDHCAECHGSYDDENFYPNLLIPQSIIQTDSLLNQSNYSNPQFVEWFNKSWFTAGDHPARLEPFKGYIAPPLDGVWITAPYLHNGSVPTIETVLNSRLRPTYWARNFDQPEYDYEKLGWKYRVLDQPGNNTTYNTRLPGYGNEGHYFGDQLSPEERMAVIEYLKTL
ncbi:MAG: c-type cytochrome [Terrimonas sp.]|nr:c-type cytochrome [Terrimonas sp.]